MDINKLLIDCGSRGQAQTLMSSRVIIPPTLQKLKELLCSPFLKQAHKRTPNCLHLSARHLRDLTISVHEAPCDLLKLEVTSDVGVYKDLGQLARRDDKFRDEIHGVITIAA